MAIAGTHLRSQAPVSVHTHCTEEVTGFEEGKGGNGVGSGSADVNNDGDGDGTRTRTGVEANKQTQGRRGTGAGTGAGTGREWVGELGWRLVDEYKMGTGTGAEKETKAISEMATGKTRMGTRTGSGRAELR